MEKDSMNGTQQSDTVDGKITGALVCGVLSLLLSGTVVLGIVLGVIAIVLASQALARIAKDGRAQAGRICGIVGIIASIAFLALWLLVAAGLVQMIGTDSGQSADQVEEAPSTSKTVEDVVSSTARNDLGNIQKLNASQQKELAKELDSNFKNSAGVSLSDLGVDPNDLVTWLTSDMDYTIDDIDVSGDEAAVSLTANSRDIQGFAGAFGTAMEAYLNSDAYSNATSETEVYQQLGAIMKSSMAQTGTTPKTTHLNYNNSNGVWTIDSTSLRNAVYDIYGLSDL
jgi:hypothetical protein